MRCSLSRALCLAALAILSVQSCNSRAAPLWENLSGEKAFAHVQHLVDLGPRPAGSEALEKSRLYIIEQLKSAGWTVTRSEFSDQTPRGKMAFVNLIARFGTSKTMSQHGSFLALTTTPKPSKPFALFASKKGDRATGWSFAWHGCLG